MHLTVLLLAAAESLQVKSLSCPSSWILELGPRLLLLLLCVAVLAVLLAATLVLGKSLQLRGPLNSHL